MIWLAAVSSPTSISFIAALVVCLLSDSNARGIGRCHEEVDDTFLKQRASRETTSTSTYVRLVM